MKISDDKHVEFLIDMEQRVEKKVYDKLLAIQKLENNVFNATWWVFQDHMMNSLKVKCRYTLNSVEDEFEFDVGIDRFQKSVDVDNQILEKIREKITRKFIDDLMSSKGDAIVTIFQQTFR